MRRSLTRLAVLFTAMLTLSLLAAACTSEEEPAPAPAPTSAPAPAPAPTTPPAPAPAPAPTAAPAPAPTSAPAPAPMAESASLTFWSDLAQNCDTRGGHLNLGNRETEFTNLNPATVNQVIQFSITAEVLSGLVQLDPELKPSPDLAESWSVSDDLLTYTFKLRENAQFHTGRQFTADDVVYLRPPA